MNPGTRSTASEAKLIDSDSALGPNLVAFFGLSWGAALGAILPALEPRLKVAVLGVGGFSLHPWA